MPEFGEKWCPSCKCAKLLADFGRHRNRSDGLAARCKRCAIAANLVYRKRHPERVAYKKGCFNRVTHRRLHLKYKFGITPERYQEMANSQCGTCAICYRRLEQVNHKRCKNFSIDHDHKTGRIRALLCTQCNAGLGQFGDDVQRLKAAVDYLESHAEVC